MTDSNSEKMIRFTWWFWLIYFGVLLLIPLLLEAMLGFLGNNRPYVKGPEIGGYAVLVFVIAISKGVFLQKLKCIVLLVVPSLFFWILGVYLSYCVFGYTIDWFYVSASSFLSLLLMHFFGIIIAWLCSYRESKKQLKMH